MNYLGFSAAQLADQIGVQRSSFSHILNGRNKPSADFISKLLQSYPDLNANWLLGDAENMLLSQRVKYLMPDLFSGQDQVRRVDPPVKKIEHIPEKKEPIKQVVNSEVVSVDISKIEIEKIIILYSDHSFTEYNPK